jgi:hypothetical protein
MRTDGPLGPVFSLDRRAVLAGAAVQAMVGTVAGAAFGIGVAFSLTAVLGGAIAGLRSSNGDDRFADGVAAAAIGTVLALLGVVGLQAAVLAAGPADAVFVNSMLAVGTVIVLLPFVAIGGAASAVAAPWLADLWLGSAGRSRSE